MKGLPSKIGLLLLAIALALFVQHAMWHGSGWWAILGIIGLVASYLIEGPHGGNHEQILVSTVVSVVSNSCVYFYLFHLASKRCFRQTDPPTLRM